MLPNSLGTHFRLQKRPVSTYPGSLTDPPLISINDLCQIEKFAVINIAAPGERYLRKLFVALPDCANTVSTSTACDNSEQAIPEVVRPGVLCSVQYIPHY